MIDRPDAAAVAAAARSARRHGVHYSLTRADLMQEGWLALLEASAAGRLPDDPQHRACYIVRRAGGAMIDATRRATAHAQQDQEDADPGAAPSPEHVVAARQRWRRLCRRASPRVVQAAALVLDGHSVVGAARVMGVTPSRVSQLLRQAVALLGR